MTVGASVVCWSVVSVAIAVAVTAQLTRLVAANGTHNILPTARTFTELYKDGVHAYHNQDWTECIDYFQSALTEWKFYRKATVECRLKCARDAGNHQPLMDEDIEHLHFSEVMIRRTLCLMKCTETTLNSRSVYIERDIEEAFLNLRPYEYLQVCYYQDSDLYKAASAAYTILCARPEDQTIRRNLQHYLQQSTILEFSSLVNYEAEKYVSSYIQGILAYVKEDYDEVVEKLERSLTDLLAAEEGCRALCEGSFDQGWFPDLAASYANHFTFCLKCKRRCSSSLSSINGEIRPDLLPQHYNYLQFAYYKLGRLVEALGAAASYLRFFPHDETMLENKLFYQNHPGYAEELFRPREEATKYVKRQEYEIKLLKFIENEFVFKNNSQRLFEAKEKETIPQARSLDPQDESSGKRRRSNIGPDIGPDIGPGFCTDTGRAEQEALLLKRSPSAASEAKRGNASVATTASFKSCKSNANRLEETMRGERRFELHQRIVSDFRSEEELGGNFRFSADGLVQKDECQILLDLAFNIGIRGDGYEGNTSPHSEMEQFEGVSFYRLAEMVRAGPISESVLDLFMKVCDRGKNISELYFGDLGAFHFAFSQIACRSGIPGRSSSGPWMSHKIHADNCQLQPNGECWKQEPAYTSNDYSAIIYLNDDFEGGEFVFSADPFGESVQSVIQPKCGRVVGFSAGPENKHGVRGVTEGRRCALGLWFTKDPLFSERTPALMQTIEEIRTRSRKKGD